jgi:hypothetical protein
MMRPVFGEHIPYTSDTKNNQPGKPELNVHIYPNPAKDFLNIQIENKNLYDYTYKIYNLQGRLMKSNQVLPARIQVSNLPAGIYILHLQHKTNLSQYRKKIIISK